MRSILKTMLFCFDKKKKSDSREGNVASPESEATQIGHWRSPSVPLVQYNSGVVGSPVSDLHSSSRSLHIDQFIGSVPEPSSPSTMDGPHTLTRSDVREILEECGFLLSKSSSEHSPDESTRSPSVMASDGKEDDRLNNQNEQLMLETVNAKLEAFCEAVRCKNSEKETMDALGKVKAVEVLYVEELKQRKEVEEELSNEKARLESIKNQLNEGMEELWIARDQKQRLEKKLSESDLIVKDLEGKFISAVELLQTFKRERDNLQMQRDNALRAVEELRENQESSCPHIFPTPWVGRFKSLNKPNPDLFGSYVSSTFSGNVDYFRG